MTRDERIEDSLTHALQYAQQFANDTGMTYYVWFWTLQDAYTCTRNLPESVTYYFPITPA